MKNNLYVTNFYAKQISFYSEEEEIIFLPFSGFIICDIEEKEDYSIIYLNYLNNYEKNVIDYIDAKSKDNVDDFLKNLIKESQNNIFKNIFSQNSLKLFGDYNDKKNVLWIDQYCQCKLYDNYLTKYSSSLKDFYIEKATTIKEAFLILSNYEFKFVYVIINGKLSREFFSQYEEKIKQLGVVTSNIIFCDEVEKLLIPKEYINHPFLNPGKLAIDFSKVVEYLNNDECGFNDTLKLQKTIDNSYTGKHYGYIFKVVNINDINYPSKAIKKIIANLPNQNSLSEFKNFIYKYGHKLLIKSVNPSLDKKIDLPLYIYPKYFMKMYGLETDFYYDINKYLSNRENDFGIFGAFITLLYYGLTENVLISNDEFPFYRGGVISKKELEMIEKNYKIKLYSCKNFLSFSKSLEQANSFIRKNLNCDKSLFPVRFIIEKYEKINEGDNDSLMSNIEIRHYSGYAKEQEVLFLPLSAFRIIKIISSNINGKEIKIITLHYIGMISK